MKKTILTILCICIMVMFSQKTFADLSTGLVGYYDFNGNALDKSGNSNNATVIGASLTTDRDGNADSAYSFDGINDYMRAANATTLQVSDTMTMSAWVFMEDQGRSRIAGVYQGDGDIEYAMMFDSKKMRMQTKNNNDQWGLNSTFSNTAISGFAWHHLIFTFDKPTYKFYLDGKLDGSGSWNSSIMNNNANPALYIGNQANLYPNEYFEGKIDELRIYNRALSETEIEQLSTGDLTGVAVAPEPVSTTLFLAGAITLGFRQLRKKKIAA